MISVKKRIKTIKATLVFILLMELSVNCEAVVLTPKRRLKDRLPTSSPQQRNICDINDRDSKVHCYCESSQELFSATKAECWVFNGGIPRDDIVWHSFASQPTMRTLSFNVRVDGALDYVPTLAFKYTPKLKQINIKYGSITTLTKYSFANLTALSEIILEQNHVENLETYAIAHLNNLTVLRLEDNIISEIRKDSFYDLPNLQNLTLNKNNISFVEDGSFSQLLNLSDLELNKNSISQLNRHTFDGLANLQRLDLRRNRLHTLNDYTFTELWNLSELLLGRNELRIVSERAFDGLSLLRKLSLNGNKLKVLPSALFEGVRGVTFVDLRLNQLAKLTYKNVVPILENLYAPRSSLLIEGNSYVCNCHLAWMYSLRNETKSAQTRQSIENVRCVYEAETPKKTTPSTLEYNDIEEREEPGRKLLTIPANQLSCPIEKTSTTEVPPMLVHLISVQNDVKSSKRKDILSNKAVKSGSVNAVIIAFAILTGLKTAAVKLQVVEAV